MTTKPRLPFGKQIAYATGQFGWSILVNLVGLQLVFFYVPPESAGIPTVITQVTILVVINAIVIITASGRLFDAITDPLIASFSDRSTSPRGRRIPFMMLGALPAAIFCILMFIPPVREVSTINIVWLFVMQVLFYATLTLYVTPFFALLPELSRDANDRLNLSTWISVTYALGIIVAAQTPLIADAIGGALGIVDRMTALQVSFIIVGVLAVILMYVPVFTIDENTYSDSKPSSIPLLTALRSTFSNRNFRYYVVADFSYFTGLTIINTGLLFYVTVLLLLEEATVAPLLALTVILSFVLYPVVNVLAKRVGKKVLITVAFMVMSIVFLGAFFLGDAIPLGNSAQAYALVILYAFPLAFLAVLPNAVLADIAHHDALKTQEPKEGMYFAARTLMQKFGQTFGVLIFAALTSLGKDPGDDLGVRLSGLAGFALCIGAGLIFTRYRERQLLTESAELEAALSQSAD